MPKPKMRDEKIQVNLTLAQKNQIEILAKKSSKSQSQYLLDSGLATTIDTAKFDFYTRINSDLNYLKRTSYVISKLELLIAAEQYNDQDFVVNFYKATMAEAERLFKD